MKNQVDKLALSDELIAAYLDGNATLAETQLVLQTMKHDAQLRELLQISSRVDADMALSLRKYDYLPMTALAAECGDEHLCSLVCEQYIMQRRNISYDANQMVDEAMKKGWLKEAGTALYNIGRHLEQAGLVATRQYNTPIQDVCIALEEGQDVILVVDECKLSNDNSFAHFNQSSETSLPNHAVVVLDCNMSDNTITIFDPNSTNESDIYTITHFMNAWADSQNYMVAIYEYTDASTYVPKPIDVSDIELGEELIELREAIAENVHDIWAIERIQEGWTYGPERNDELKTTPCLVPYSKLPDSEKEYDRKTAMQTIQLIKKLGYELVK